MSSTTLVEQVASAPPAVCSDEPLFEIIDGQRVELPPMSAFASRIATRLVRKVGDFADTHNLGEASMEVLFHLSLPIDRNRRPDVAFVSYERWPRDKVQPERDNAWDVVPDLAVEVLSPNDLAEEVRDRVEEYFRAGVRLMWIVYPRHRIVYVYETPAQVRILARTDELDGGNVLPGFRLPLATLFPEQQPG